MLGLAPDKLVYGAADTDSLIEARKHRFGANLKLSYRKPIQILRGWRHYLYDQHGRTHLDAYNNVPHVGHAHPRIAAVIAILGEPIVPHRAAPAANEEALKNWLKKGLR